MKIFVVTDDGKKHETEIAKEHFCHEYIATARDKSINPAEAVVALACAGSVSIEGNKIIPENNEILRSMLQCG